MAPTLYMTEASPPVRAILITAKAIELNLNQKKIDFVKGDQYSPEYLKINPQHTVPTLIDDDGFTIWDSHAILSYLIAKYAKNDALYPEDIKKRAIIDQRLYFESGVVFYKLRKIAKPILIDGKKTIDEEDIKDIHEAYSFLESFIADNKWVAGDSISIADYSLVSSISSGNFIVPIDAQKFPKLAAWLKRMEELPEYEANKKGLQELTEMFKAKLTEV